VPLVESLTERTTAATDLLLGVAAVLALPWIRATVPADRTRATLWRAVLGLLAVAGALGAVAHGLALPAAWSHALWQPLYLALGLLVALFVVAAVHDLLGAAAARRTLVPLLLVGAGFYGLTAVGDGSFLPFILYEASAMLLALAGYAVLASRGKLRGAAWICAGIALNLTAAAVQASSLGLTLIVPFDHNGLFHLVQLVALAVLVAGVRAGMEPGA